MSGFFRVPAILFDRGIYPPCLGLFEDAFKQLILESSFINRHSGLQFSNQRAAKNYLGFSEEKYKAVKKELVKNQFVLRYYKKKGPDEKPTNKNTKRKTWGCSNPPLLKLGEVDGNSEICFFRPQCEPQSGLSAMFHHSETSFGFIQVPTKFARTVDSTGGGMPSFLSVMSPDEIDVYFNLLCQNREHWVGINPNYLRYDIDMPLDPFERTTLENDLNPIKEWPSELVISPALINRIQKSVEELEEIINTLNLKYNLLEWHFWIASYAPYYERRRGKVSYNFQLLYYLNSDAIGQMGHIYISMLREVLLTQEHLTLIAQLRPIYNLSDEFERIIINNCKAKAWPDESRILERIAHASK